jgi:glycosyltransferase involved in cell wall biosynthesis
VRGSDRLVASAMTDAARRNVSARLLFDERIPHIEDLARNPEDHISDRAGIAQPRVIYGYFIGAWYRVDLNVLRDAVRANVSRLGIRLGAAWIVVPVPTRLLRIGYRWLRPLFAGLQSVLIGTRKCQRRLAHILWVSGAKKLAIGDGRPVGFVKADLQSVLEALIRRPASSYQAVPDRVVHVCGNLQPGGAERQVVYTLGGLARCEIESVQLLCHFLSGGEHGFYVPMLKVSGVGVREIRRHTGRHEFSGLPSPLGSILGALPPELATDVYNICLEFLELRPEIVHAWLDWDNVRAGLAAVLVGVPKVVLSGRNLSPKHFSLYQPYMDPVYRVLTKVPAVTFINNSRAGADDYADWIGIPRDRIAVVHNAIDFGSRTRLNGDAARSLRNSFGLSHDAFVVGGVFRLCEEKRPLTWIETAKLVSQQVPHAQFIIFGAGPMQRLMEQKIDEAGLSERVILAGLIADVLPAMSVMDVLLLSSSGEGLPNVLLEAQWVGTPVVATAVGGVKEAIDDAVTGWAIEMASPQDLADRIVWLHAHPEVRADVLTLAPLFVREKFGLDRMIRAVAEIYGVATATMSGTSGKLF